jgi:hypothetical protein
MNNLLYSFIFLFALNINSQSSTVKVLDSLTLSSIPFATVYFSNNKGIITDIDGRFELINEQYGTNDSLFISSMGYKKTSLKISSFKDSIVYMIPEMITLENVVVTNRNLSSNEIIEKVKAGIEQNYQKEISEKKIFYRYESNRKIDKIELNKFKSSIDQVNSSILDSLLIRVPKENKSATETLCYYYGNLKEGKQKINLIKSRLTYKKDDDILNSINSRLKEALQENLKSNSYFKIKSGLLPFSADLSIDGLWEIDSTNQEALKKAQDLELKRKQNFAAYQKSRITNIYSNLFYNEETKLDFILKSNRYRFGDPELTYLGNQLVYVISCFPKGSKDYKGVLYVNSDDFAVVRIDFENVKSLFKFKLLGVSTNVYLEEGRMVFSKLNNKKYSLSYFQVSNGRKSGIDRPIKVVEKNKYVKGRRKQNQISFKLDLIINSLNKQELQIFQSKTMDIKGFENIKENNKVLPEYLDEFTTNFWEEF